MTQENIPTTSEQEPNLWDNQTTLAANYNALQASGANEDELAAAADAVNRNVACLVKNGELDPEGAWSLSVGENPYLDTEQSDHF